MYEHVDFSYLSGVEALESEPVDHVSEARLRLAPEGFGSDKRHCRGSSGSSVRSTPMEPPRIANTCLERDVYAWVVVRSVTI